MLFKSIINLKDLHSSTFWVVIGLLVGIILLEFSTPPDYVFGYLYLGPILLSNTRLSRKTTLQVTLLACLLTLLNLWLPGRENVSIATSVSRIIATLALIVTGILSDRNRLYQQALLQQQAKLQAAEKLADVREDFAAMLAHDLKTSLLDAIEQLQRVFANLFTNAINHSPRGSKVEVNLESSSAYQTVKILDVGAGIIPEELPYLFERFYQGRSDRQASGTGLGLYLSRQIIEAHGGTIWAENRSPLGAMFAFRLPALSRHLAA